MPVQDPNTRPGDERTAPASASERTAGSPEPAVEAVSPGILLARQYGILVFWIAICVGFSVASDPFLSTDNLLSIFEHSAIIGILAAGEAIVIIAAGIDLTIAPVAAISGIVAAKVLKADAPPLVAIVAALGSGFAAGWLNGFIVVRMRIEPLIATLGTFSALTGLGLILTNGAPIFGLDDLRWLGSSELVGIATPTWIMLGVFGLLALVMGSTVWGVRLQAVGGNIEAARRAGVSVNRYLWGAFVVSGLCAALAGLVIFGTLSTAEPVVSNSLIFEAITAVALAGVLLSGGRGSLPKVLIGALILGTIQNGLTLRGVPDYWQLVTTGVLLVAAVWIDGTLSRAIERRRTMVPVTSDPTPSA